MDSETFIMNKMVETENIDLESKIDHQSRGDFSFIPTNSELSPSSPIDVSKLKFNKEEDFDNEDFDNEDFDNEDLGNLVNFEGLVAQNGGNLEEQQLIAIDFLPEELIKDLSGKWNGEEIMQMKDYIIPMQGGTKDALLNTYSELKNIYQKLKAL
jgi:hypothetical protein